MNQNQIVNFWGFLKNYFVQNIWKEEFKNIVECDIDF